MLPLHQVLPRLEDAVRGRRADPTVDGMSEGDLRELLYSVVHHYCRQIADPDGLFDAMIDAANETVEEFRDASSAAASMRAQLLTRMLQLAARAMAALSGRVCTKITRSHGEQVFEHHPLLRGVEMGLSKRTKSDSTKARTISHQSWWIVTLGGDTDCSEPDTRWATLTHRGVIDATGSGEENINVELVTALELAETTTREEVLMMLGDFMKRLRNITKTDSRLIQMTAEDNAWIIKVGEALATMESK